MKPRIIHFFVLIAVLFSLLKSPTATSSALAAQKHPAGLNESDWQQILTLLSPAQQAYLKASTPSADDSFGNVVAVSDEIVVIGAPYEDSNANGVNGNEDNNSATDSGAVYVFTRVGSTWSQQAYLKASNTGASDWFGSSVAISGNTIVVGASGEDSNAGGINGNQADNSASASGAVYIFTRKFFIGFPVWSQQAYIKASNTGTNDKFGASVSISGDTIIVGASYEDSNASGVNGNQSNNSASDSGAAYIFTRTGSNWNQQAYLKASNTGANDLFGYSVAISGDSVVVGAMGEASNAGGINGDQSDDSAILSGAAYVFTRNDTTWSQQAYLKASNAEENDVFGASASISGDTIVIGAPLEASNATGVNGNQGDNSASASGAAYVFTRSGSNWSQQAYLKASNTAGTDYFGQSVAIDSDTIVIGVPNEDSNATGVNGNQADNSMSESGAAFVFTRNGVNWSQQAYLKASNTGASDWFGTSVAISGNMIISGAKGEDSNSTGVNGNGSNNSLSAAGAAYAFIIPHTITFNSNGGSGSMNNQTASSPAAINSNAFTRTNYTFIDWNTVADGSGTSYTDGSTYDFSTDITLYAQWAANNHTVTFNPNGGVGSMSDQVANTTTPLSPNTFTRAGYSFTGWNSASDGSGTSYANNAAYSFSADITLYAQWVIGTPTFADVPLNYWAWQFIERLYQAGITGGCTPAPLNYCPENPVTRAQMAVFLEKALHGSAFIPPNVPATFTDTPGHWAEDWIEALKADGITGGCGSGIYCPENSVTRAQMAVFLLKSTHGASYSPPPATGTFSDVSTDYWAAAWIEQLAAEGITSGCGSGIYCPENAVTRAQMAVFLVKAFNLP